MELLVKDFKGWRNNEGELSVPPDNFFRISNFNYDSRVGANKIFFPEMVTPTELVATKPIDGIYEYKFLDNTNVLQTMKIAVSGGKIFKNFDTTPSVIYNGLVEGICKFVTYQDKLFIVNGKNYPKIFWGAKNFVYEMGAPAVEDANSAGNLFGTYYYAITFVKGGVEQWLGTISNTITVNNSKVTVNIPTGWTGVTQRKIYRTVNGGSQLKLVTVVANNTDLTYTDNISDSSLGLDIMTTPNNECPKPYFIESSQQRLILSVNDRYPTQSWVSETFLELVDLKNFVDVSNIGSDNTRVLGIKHDYGKIVAGTEKNLFIIDTSVAAPTVTLTRANVGVKNGYTMDNVPKGSVEGYGGTFFASSILDIRGFNGNLSIQVSSSLDNIRTDTFTLSIRESMKNALNSASTFYAKFYDYKYHLILDNKIFVYDIRTNAWTLYEISDTQQPEYSYMEVIAGDLYLGRKDKSIIEKMYATVDYNGEDMPAYFESPQLLVSEDVKYFRELVLYFASVGQVEADVTITVENDTNTLITGHISLNGGVYDMNYYNPLYYLTSQTSEDFRVIYINRPARWLKYKVNCTKGAFYFKGFRLVYDAVSNKE